MENIDLLEDVAPSSNEIGAIANMATRMLELENEIALIEEATKQMKQDLAKLAEQDLPELMQELNIRNFTLSNGAKVEVNEIISGSVPSATAIDRAKGDDKVALEIRQQHCFDWLRANGAGDLIKSNVEVQFGRDEDDACNTFIDELQDRHIYYKRAKAVHPGTLNSFIKERLSEGKEVPHDLFRIYTGRKAKIRR
jgi:hypothetical protein